MKGYASGDKTVKLTCQFVESSGVISILTRENTDATLLKSKLDLHDTALARKWLTVGLTHPVVTEYEAYIAQTVRIRDEFRSLRYPTTIQVELQGNHTQRTYNVSLTRIRETSAASENKQVLNTLCVCVCVCVCVYACARGFPGAWACACSCVVLLIQH